MFQIIYNLETLLKRLIFFLNWNKILKNKKIPIWKKSKINSIKENHKRKKILFATSYGSHDVSLKIDSLIAYNLKLNDQDPEFLFCDEFLNICSQVNYFSFKKIEALFSKGIKDRCIYCWGCARKSLDNEFFKVHKMKSYLKNEDKKEIENIYLNTLYDDIFNFKLDGINLGEHVYSSSLRFFARGDLNDKFSKEIVKKYFYASLLTFFSFRNFIKKNKFDTIVTNHGLYIPQGVIMDIAKKNDINVVTWFSSYKNKTFIYSHKDTYHKTFLVENNANWENINLTKDKEKLLLDYIDQKSKGRTDWHVFQHKNSLNDYDNFIKKYNIDKNKPLIALFTNVIWDAQLYYDQNIFKNMIEWLVETINYSTKKNLQIAIRVHPAEDMGLLPSRQKVKDELLKYFDKLPKNIFLINSNDNLNSYMLIKNSLFSIVYASTIANEIVSLGKNVIAAGETWVKNKQISLDPKNKIEYFQMIDKLLVSPKIEKNKIIRARKYSYYFYFKKMIPINSLINEEKKKYNFSLDKSIEDIFNQKTDRGIKVISEGIANNTNFTYEA